MVPSPGQVLLSVESLCGALYSISPSYAMRFIYVRHLLYSTVTEYVTADYSLHGQATLVNYTPYHSSCQPCLVGKRRIHLEG